MKPLKLYVTINGLLYREALLHQLLLHEHIQLVGESETGFETLALLPKTHPDVLIVEENLTDNDGLTISEIALSQLPLLNILLLVDGKLSAQRLSIYLESGIKSVVSKTQSLSELVEAMHYIGNGQPYIGRGVYQAITSDESLLDAYKSLSEREHQVAHMMADRVPFKSIASELGVSYKTVHSYKERIYAKMGFERASELILFVQRANKQKRFAS